MIPRTIGRWTVLATPLAVAIAWCPRLFLPFSTAKLGVLAVLSAICLIASALTSQSKIENRKSKIFLAFWISVAALLAIQVLSAALSDRPRMALWPLVISVSGILLLVAAPRLLSPSAADRRPSTKPLHFFLIAIAAAAALAAIVAIAQAAFGLDLWAWAGAEVRAEGRMRIFSTLGNPNFAGAFLASTMWAAAALGLRTRSRLWKWMWLGVAAASAVGAALTGSRDAQLAIAAGGAVFVLASGWKRVARGRWTRVLLVAGLVALVAAGVLMAERINPRKAEQAVAGRRFIWRTAVSGGVTALGEGPGTFAYVYPTRLAQRAHAVQAYGLRSYGGYEVHAHNELIESAVETGWLGALALLAVGGSWTLLVWTRGRGVARAASLAGVAAIATAAMFDFPLRRPEGWMLACAWMAMGIASLESQCAGEGAGSKAQAARTLRVTAACVLALIVVGAAGMLVIANGEVQRGRIAEARNDYSAAEDAYRRALRLDAASAEGRFDLTRVLCKQGRLDECWAASDEALDWVNEAELHLLRIRTREAMGDRAGAMREWTEAYERFPWSPEVTAELQRLNQQ